MRSGQSSHGLARKLKFGGAVHSGSRLMAWCVGNAKEEQGRQSVMINKYANGAAKIEGSHEGSAEQAKA